jgi:hypothetical protein
MLFHPTGIQKVTKKDLTLPSTKDDFEIYFDKLKSKEV